jgi:hypothetical protein
MPKILVTLCVGLLALKEPNEFLSQFILKICKKNQLNKVKFVLTFPQKN